MRSLGLLMGVNFHLDPKRGEDAKTIGYLFAYCGVIGALVQGGAIGRIVKKAGEPRVIANSLFLVALSMAPMPFVRGSGAGAWLLLLAVLSILSIGSSMTRPPVFGLISNLTSAHEQGATIGVAQSAGSLARIIGPMFAATLLDVSAPMPYLICSGISLVTALVVVQKLCSEPQSLTTNDAANMAR